MSWVETIPAFVTAVVLVFGPGLLWGSVLGLRRLALVAVAGPFSVTAMVVAAELGGLTVARAPVPASGVVSLGHQMLLVGEAMAALGRL